MKLQRFRQLDEALFYSVKNDLQDFTLDDGDIVRVGEWGYMKAAEYEALFNSDREQSEYQAVSNAYNGGCLLETIKLVTVMSDDELNEFLSDLNDSGDCLIYYTEAEE